MPERDDPRREFNRLLRIFERLSARSRYLRFLGPKSRLTERELDYLTQVDHADHEALLATDMADGQPLGVCRYRRMPSDGAAAEVAIAVVDAWQARGLGTALLRLLAEHALAEGIQRFTEVVLGENRRVIALIKRLGPVEVRYAHGLGDVVVERRRASSFSRSRWLRSPRRTNRLASTTSSATPMSTMPAPWAASPPRISSTTPTAAIAAGSTTRTMIRLIVRTRARSFSRRGRWPDERDR